MSSYRDAKCRPGEVEKKISKMEGKVEEEAGHHPASKSFRVIEEHLTPLLKLAIDDLDVLSDFGDDQCDLKFCSIMKEDIDRGTS